MIDLNKLNQLLNPFGGFGQQQQQQMPSPTNPTLGIGMMDQSLDGQPNEDDELNKALMSLLTPKDEQYDRFTQMLGNIPQRSEHQPGLGRRIAGFVAGLGAGGAQGISGGQPIGYKSDIPGGLKIQQSINEEPYSRALNDWKINADPTLEAAKLENTRNVNSRISASGIKTAQLRESTIDRQLKRDEQVKSKEDAETSRKSEDQKIRKQRADAYVYKTMHPNHEFIETGGLIYSIDPITSKTEVVKDSDGDPIESDKLGDEAKANLGLKNARELENLRQSGRESLEDTRQSDRESLEKTRQLNRIETKTTPSASTSGIKDETPTAKQQRIYNRAVEAVNKHPEWREYISVDKLRKVPDILTPEAKKGSWFSKPSSGGDPKVTEEILKFIYGDEAEPTKATKRADGKVHVRRKSDKVEGWITNPNLSLYELIP